MAAGDSVLCFRVLDILCRWHVRRMIAPARRARTLSPPTLRRVDAMNQQALQQTWGDYSSAPFPYDSSAFTQKAKPLPTDKKTAKKQGGEKYQFQRVMVPFPPMVAPFGKLTKFDASRNTVRLTLSFRHESNRPEVQKLRGVLTSLEEALNQLIEIQAPAPIVGDPISIKNKNTFVRPGKPTKEFPGTWYPDTIALKMYLEDVKFKTTEGEELMLDDIRFREFDVQPVVELRDLFKMSGTYYPRLVVKSCTLHPHAVGKVTMLPPPTSMDWSDCVFEPTHTSDDENVAGSPMSDGSDSESDGDLSDFVVSDGHVSEQDTVQARKNHRSGCLIQTPHALLLRNRSSETPYPRLAVSASEPLVVEGPLLGCVRKEVLSLTCNNPFRQNVHV